MSKETQEKTPHQLKWGKMARDVAYGEPCSICGSRVDEFGLCSCGAGGG